MQKTEFIQFISHPGRLNSDTLDEILKVREAYPYFQTAHLLAVKNKFLLGQDDWQSEIESVSAFVTDRQVLYDLLYPLTEDLSDTPTQTEPEPIAQAPAQTAPEPVAQAPAQTEPEPLAHIPTQTDSPSLRDNISNLLSWQLGDLELLDPSEAELMPEIAVDIEKAYGNKDAASQEQDIFTLDTEPEPDTPAPVEADKNELIAKFIETNPRMEPRLDSKPTVDISEDSVKEHDGIFTDTLARIYIKQGYYSKAIFAYEKLILKYPEKSDYFAGQIEAIKKLMNKQ